jgi:hypothetical protein
LFISYDLDGTEYRFFQSTDYNFSYKIVNTNQLLDGRYIFSNEYQFHFTGINHLSTESFNPEITLNFYDTTLWKDGDYLHQKALRNRLHNTYRFMIPEILSIDSIKEIDLADTLFFEGVAFSINTNEYSTENLINYFQFNRDSISKYIWNESYFTISKIEQECGFNKSIEGKFSTSLSDWPYTKLVKIVNGHFRIYINR